MMEWLSNQSRDRSVEGSYATSVNDLPVEQLDLCVRLQHANFRHPVVFRDVEAVL